MSYTIYGLGMLAYVIKKLKVLAHMDYRDPLVDVIHRSIRQRHATMPIQVLAGHSHIRGYRRAHDRL